MHSSKVGYIKLLPVFVMLFILFGCAIHPRILQRKIVYHLFQSLEDSLASIIDKQYPYKPLGVIIEICGSDCLNKKYVMNAEGKYDSVVTPLNPKGNFYALALAYSFHRRNGFWGYFSGSNRYLSIHNSLYPVSFIPIDGELVTYSYNAVGAYDNKNLSARYRPLPVEFIEYKGFYTVNMTDETFYNGSIF